MKKKIKNRLLVTVLMASHLAETLLYHFFQSPCCCLNCKGCNGNVFLYFSPGWTWVCSIFNIKHSIIDPRKWFSSIFVVPTWSKDDVPIRKKKNAGWTKGYTYITFYILFLYSLPFVRPHLITLSIVSWHLLLLLVNEDIGNSII